jgi:hypothetical protein
MRRLLAGATLHMSSHWNSSAGLTLCLPAEVMVWPAANILNIQCSTYSKTGQTQMSQQT